MRERSCRGIPRTHGIGLALDVMFVLGGGLELQGIAVTNIITRSQYGVNESLAPGGIGPSLLGLPM